MDIYQIFLNNLDIPFISALIYIIAQFVKFTKFPNKYLPILCFVAGAIASVILQYSKGPVDLNTQTIMTMIRTMFIYGSGAIVLYTVIHKTFPSIGDSIDEATGKITKSDNNILYK